MKIQHPDNPMGILSGSSTRRALLGGIVGGVLGLSIVEHGTDVPALAQSSCEPTPTPDPTPTPTPPTSTIHVRRDLHSLAVSGPELQAFAQGVAAMKLRASNDPTSWAFQASMHPSNCQHNTIHFLSWHRMYVYFFERIIRDAANEPTFTIPFWNYAVANQRILPAPFRDSSNPLYVAQRSWAVRSGQQPAPDQNYRFDHSAAFAAINFTHTGNGTSFAGRVGARGLLENAPHNLVHSWIGGYMGTLENAALDPVFWMHHANLDRLWEEWLRLSGGRANPAGGVFLDTVFTFYNPSGAPVQMTGRDILDTVGQLDYRYEGQSPLSGQVAAGRKSRRSSKPRTNRDVGASAANRLTLASREVEIPVEIRDGAIEQISAAAGRKSKRASLTFKSVSGGGVRGVTYEVHVNATHKSPNPNAKSFVGAIGLFGLQPDDRPGHGKHTADISFDITKAISGARDGKQVTVTLVPVELDGRGALPGGTWATIERLVISVTETGRGTRKKKKQRAKRRNGKQEAEQEQAANPRKRRSVNRKKKQGDIKNKKEARSQQAGEVLSVSGHVDH